MNFLERIARAVRMDDEFFRTLSRFYTDSRSPAVHHPFERTGMPLERLELTVLKNSSSIRTARAIRSRKFISRSNGSSCTFKKETVSYFGSRSKKTRWDDFKTINSPFFVKWRMPSCLHYTNSRHASVLCLPPLKWYSLNFLRKNVWFTSSY